MIATPQSHLKLDVSNCYGTVVDSHNQGIVGPSHHKPPTFETSRKTGLSINLSAISRPHAKTSPPGNQLKRLISTGAEGEVWSAVRSVVLSPPLAPPHPLAPLPSPSSRWAGGFSAPPPLPPTPTPTRREWVAVKVVRAGSPAVWHYRALEALWPALCAHPNIATVLDAQGEEEEEEEEGVSLGHQHHRDQSDRQSDSFSLSNDHSDVKAYGGGGGGGLETLLSPLHPPSAPFTPKLEFVENHSSLEGSGAAAAAAAENASMNAPLRHHAAPRGYPRSGGGGRYFITTPLFGGGDLLQLMQREGEKAGGRGGRGGGGGRGLGEARACQLFSQVASALGHCHGLGVFHRDVKLENILVDRAGATAVLCDFGSALVVPHHALSPAWPPASWSQTTHARFEKDSGEAEEAEEEVEAASKSRARAAARTAAAAGGTTEAYMAPELFQGAFQKNTATANGSDVIHLSAHTAAAAAALRPVAATKAVSASSSLSSSSPSSSSAPSPASLASASLAAADVWSLGVLLFALTTGHLPWRSARSGGGAFPLFPSHLSPSLVDLLRLLLALDPERRPSMAQVVNHPWCTSAAKQDTMSNTTRKADKAGVGGGGVDGGALARSTVRCCPTPPEQLPRRAIHCPTETTPLPAATSMGVARNGIAGGAATNALVVAGCETEAAEVANAAALSIPIAGATGSYRCVSRPRPLMHLVASASSRDSCDYSSSVSVSLVTKSVNHRCSSLEQARQIFHTTRKATTAPTAAAPTTAAEGGGGDSSPSRPIFLHGSSRAMGLRDSGDVVRGEERGGLRPLAAARHVGAVSPGPHHNCLDHRATIGQNNKMSRHHRPCHRSFVECLVPCKQLAKSGENASRLPFPVSLRSWEEVATVVLSVRPRGAAGGAGLATSLQAKHVVEAAAAAAVDVWDVEGEALVLTSVAVSDEETVTEDEGGCMLDSAGRGFKSTQEDGGDEIDLSDLDNLFCANRCDTAPSKKRPTLPRKRGMCLSPSSVSVLSLKRGRIEEAVG